MLTSCPLCQHPLTAQSGAKDIGTTADSYHECARVCLDCGIALSNARRPTFIRREWRDGLWRRRTAGRLLRVLAGSLRGTEKKKERLAHERSEDLLTWNVFSWLEDRQLLPRVFSLLDLPSTSNNVRIFYWGFNDRYSRQDLRVAEELRTILTQTFKEPSLSEPDVILVNDKSLVLIEAKFDSPNDKQVGKNVDRYVDPVTAVFAAKSQVEQAGYYELTRNWAIGSKLAATLSKDFALVNLVRQGQEPNIETAFGAALAKPNAFKRLTWEQLVETVEPALIAHLEGETLYFDRAFASLARRVPSNSLTNDDASGHAPSD